MFVLKNMSVHDFILLIFHINAKSQFRFGLDSHHYQNFFRSDKLLITAEPQNDRIS